MKPHYLELLKQVKDDHEREKSYTKNSKVLIIDGTNTYLRVFSANPALNDNGEHVGGVYGFINTLKTIMNLINPTRVIIVFDGKGGSQRRKKMYSGYKQGRALKSKLNRVLDLDIPDEQRILRMQFARLLDYLECLPVTVLSYDYVEADDVIAYITTSCLSEQVVIYSNDKDYFQLINDNVSVYFPAKSKLYKRQDIIDEYGILPENFIWNKVILGDRSDNVSGVKGIGETKFNAAFTFLKERIYSLDEFKTALTEHDNKIINTVKESIDILIRNYYIMQLADVQISGNTKSKIREILDGDIQPLNKYRLKKLFLDDKMGGLIKNFELWLSTNFDKLNKYRNDK